MVNRQLKELVDTMCDAIDALSEIASLPDGIGKKARIEMGMFMMYLSASDGQISWDEASIISDICELDLSPNDLGRFIREFNIYSTEFEQTVPVTFRMVVQADNDMFASEIDSSGSEAMLGTEAMLGAYKAIGEALIKSDGDVDVDEVNDYKIYINMLEEYRDKNCGASGGATGFVKKGSSVSAPAKGGVIAPKKG